MRLYDVQRSYVSRCMQRVPVPVGAVLGFRCFPARLLKLERPVTGLVADRQKPDSVAPPASADGRPLPLPTLHVKHKSKGSKSKGSTSKWLTRLGHIEEVGAGDDPKVVQSKAILTHTSNRFLMSLKATNLKPSALPQVVCSSSRITRRSVDSICSPVMAWWRA